jgi:hypothetical protein
VNPAKPYHDQRRQEVERHPLRSVPAFIRVEPAIGSGPMSSQIGQSEIPHHLLPFFYWLFSDRNLACSRLSLWL